MTLLPNEDSSYTPEKPNPIGTQLRETSHAPHKQQSTTSSSTNTEHTPERENNIIEPRNLEASTEVKEETSSPRSLPTDTSKDIESNKENQSRESQKAPSTQTNSANSLLSNSKSSFIDPMPDNDVIRIANSIKTYAEQSSEDTLDIELEETSSPPEEYEAVKVESETSFSLNSESDADDILDKKIAQALALEDELNDVEHKNQEYMSRQTSLDDVRIRAQATNITPSTAVVSIEGTQLNLGMGSHQQQSSSNSMFNQLSNISASPGSSNSLATIHTIEQNLPSETTHRARQIVYASIERLKEITRNRQFNNGKLNLSINIDDVTRVKLTITAKEGGGHELALLVANPKLRNELKRSVAELKSAATDLPIDISDIVVDAIPEGLIKEQNHDKLDLSWSA